MQTPLSAMPPPQPDKVETQHLASPDEPMHILSVSYSISASLSIASPEVYMHPSLSYYIIRILPWFSRETQDFASLHGCRRQSSIEGMRSIHRIHGKVETQHLASPGGTMRLSSSYYIMRILPWFSRETQDFASLHGCRRKSSIEGMRSIHRIHGKVETQNLASPDESMHILSVSYSISASCNLASPEGTMHLSSSSYSIHITMFLQYCPAPTASRYAAWRAVRCKCWQSYSGHL